MTPRHVQFACLLCMALASAAGSAARAAGSDPGQAAQAPPTMDAMDDRPAGAPGQGMDRMTGHMHMSASRPLHEGDRQRADAVAQAAREAMEPYRDYRKALADGYEIFLPHIPQPLYHFTRYADMRAARAQFDPRKPSSLLYRKTSDGGYELIGVMYTDRVDASEDELDGRIPLSIAHWHQHVNFCRAPVGQLAGYFGPNARFGLVGSINTKEECDKAGGKFLPHVLGWMVHVYPYESDPDRVWSTDDDHGHDNMGHAAMPGMKMD